MDRQPVFPSSSDHRALSEHHHALAEQYRALYEQHQTLSEQYQAIFEHGRPRPPPAPTPHSKGTSFLTLQACDAATNFLLSAVQQHSPYPTDGSGHITMRGNKFQYRVMLDPEPSQIRWTLGTGIGGDKGDHHSPIYFKLDIGKDDPCSASVLRHVDSLHAEIFIHPFSGAVVLCSLSYTRPTLVRYPGLPVYKLLKNDTDPNHSSLVITTLSTHIQIGPFNFILQLNDHATGLASKRKSNRLKNLRNAAMLRHGGVVFSRLSSMPVITTPVHHQTVIAETPTHTAMTYTEMNFFSGIHVRTGEPLAGYQLLLTNDTERDVHELVRTIGKLGGDVSTGALGMVGTWREPGPGSSRDDITTFKAKKEDQWLCYTVPLDRHTFHDAPWPNISAKARLRYFRQTLRGLRKVHNTTMIHGNINPQNLVLVIDRQRSIAQFVDWNKNESHETLLSAAITDLHMASDGPFLTSEPSDPAKAWSAPEVRKSSYSTPSYSADIWSIALSWWSTFEEVPDPTEGMMAIRYPVLRRSIRAFQSTLLEEERILFPLFDLILSMLKWNACDRPSVKEALSHDVWGPVSAETNNGSDEWDEQHEREVREEWEKWEGWAKWEEPEEPEGHRRKRVRIASPQPEDILEIPRDSTSASSSSNPTHHTLDAQGRTSPPPESDADLPQSQVSTASESS